MREGKPMGVASDDPRVECLYRRPCRVAGTPGNLPSVGGQQLVGQLHGAVRVVALRVGHRGEAELLEAGEMEDGEQLRRLRIIVGHRAAEAEQLWETLKERLFEPMLTVAGQ